MFPVITNPPQTIDAEFGAEVVLTCKATAQPPPIYTWFEREGNVSVSVEGETQEILSFDKLKPVDRGVYFCKAENELGVAVSDDAILSINGIEVIIIF